MGSAGTVSYVDLVYGTRRAHHSQDEIFEVDLVCGLCTSQTVFLAVGRHAELELVKDISVFTQRSLGNCDFSHGVGFDVHEFDFTQEIGLGFGRSVDLNDMGFVGPVSQQVEPSFIAGGIEEIADDDCQATALWSHDKPTDDPSQIRIGSLRFQILKKTEQ